MTALATPLARPATALRGVLLLDGVGTAALGVLALAATEPIADAVATPALIRATGVLFVVLGLAMLAVRRLPPARLSSAALVLAELDLAWAAGTSAAAFAFAVSGTGRALVLGVAAICIVMGGTKLVLARSLRRTTGS